MHGQQLVRLFFEHSGKDVDKWEQYLGIYEAELDQFVRAGVPVRLLEIGVQNGGSLELWTKVLPSGSVIIGVDIDPLVGSLRFDSANTSAIVVDATDHDAVRQALGSETFDIIIDDGSHVSRDIIKSFSFLFDRLAPNGKYFIEDLHCSYMPSYEGGLEFNKSSIEFFKRLIDGINADHFLESTAVPLQDREFYARYNSLLSRVTFYDSLVVVQKLPNIKGRPYRRFYNGTESDVVGPLDWLKHSDSKQLQMMVFGPSVIQRLNSLLLEIAEERRDLYGSARAQLTAMNLLFAELGNQLDITVQRNEQEIVRVRKQLAEHQARTYDSGERQKVLEHRITLLSNELASYTQDRASRVARSFRRKLKQTVKLLGRTVVFSRVRGPQTGLPERNVSAGLSDTEVASVRAVFDNEWYDEQNARIERVYSGDPVADFIRDGWRYGLSPTRLFNVSWYTKQYSVKPSAELDAFTDYMRSPAAAEHDPCLLFSSSWYRNQVSEEALSDTNPLVHYVTKGSRQNASPHPLFEPWWYRQQLDGEIDADTDPLAHYLRLAGRATADPHHLFQGSWYLKTYEAAAGSALSPLEHYLEEGAALGFNPNPLFHTTWYLHTYPDIAGSNVNALVHYVVEGDAEGRDPNPLLSNRWYQRRYPDVKAAGVKTLTHYLHHGGFEGRLPNPNFEAEWFLGDDAGPLVNQLQRHFEKEYASTANVALRRSANDQVGTAYEHGYDESEGTSNSDAAYERLIVEQSMREANEVQELAIHISTMIVRPIVLIFIEGGNEKERAETQSSLEEQIYRDWEVFEQSNLGQLRTSRLPDRFTYFIWLRAGQRLHRQALYEIASAANAYPLASVIYSDSDSLSAEGKRHTPFFKPDWSPDYLESYNFIGNTGCFKLSETGHLIRMSLSLYDFILRATEPPTLIYHIDSVLLHDPCPNAVLPDPLALSERLTRTGRKGRVLTREEGLSFLDIELEVEFRPLVSIVIPTAGKVVNLNGREIDLVRNCISSLTAKTSYPVYEIIVVHNGDLSSETYSSLVESGCRMVLYDDKEFNVARKLNLGASLAEGEYLLLLNDDTEPLILDWMERLVDQLSKPHVGVVGSKLLYPDSTIQHAGVTTSNGSPDHICRGFRDEDGGYFLSLQSTRNFAAVTGACMMTRASLFNKVGGYTEELAVSYNDVDYCLKVREAGYTVVHVPRSKLVHFESKSRVPSLNPAEAAYFRSRWASTTSRDPYYNGKFFETMYASFKLSFNGLGF